tara:strand:+ start:284 stop:586 length:303 start_codon:yes stop_codon:yes gene_type:complete
MTDNNYIDEISDLVDSLRSIEKDLNISNFNETEKKVYWTILGSISKIGKCNITDVIKKSSLSRSTIYKTINKFEHNNIVMIEQSGIDKREFNINLKIDNN